MRTILQAVVIIFASKSISSFHINSNSRLVRFNHGPSPLCVTEDVEGAMIEEAVIVDDNAQLQPLIPEVPIIAKKDSPSLFIRLFHGEFFQKRAIAVLSGTFASVAFAFQHSQPVSGVALLKAMEKDSIDIKVAICNNKPTLIEFYADWCESCKAMAPSMRAIENEYKDRINFITIDGSSSEKYNADMVRRFRVDGIPHIAFIDPKNEVKTALVGAVPKKILDQDVVALLQEKPLPFEGYDAFEEESHFPLNDIPGKACPIVPSS